MMANDTHTHLVLTGFQGEASSYLTSLEIATVEKRDLAAVFSLNVTNPYGFQVLCSHHASYGQIISK